MLIRDIVIMSMLISLSGIAFAQDVPVDSVIIETDKEVFEISGTDFTDYNFFGSSDVGVTGIDVGTPGYTSSVRNFLNSATASERDSSFSGTSEKKAVLGNIWRYNLTANVPPPLRRP